MAVPDYSGTLVSVPANVRAVQGGTWQETVGTGASLGSELVVNGAFDTDTVWVKGTGWAISGGSANASSVSSNLQQNGILTIGKRYQCSYHVSVAGGSVKTLNGTAKTSSQTVTEEWVATSANLYFSGTSFTGSIDNVSIKEVIPSFTTPVLSNGGYISKPATQNLLSGNRDLNNSSWIKRGTCSVTKNLTGADGITNTGWTITGIGSAGNDIYQNKVSLAISSRHEPSFCLKAISTSGEIAIQNYTDGFSSGRWIVDLSLLGNGWQIITRNNPAVTVQYEFTSNASGASGVGFYKYSGTGDLSIGYFDGQYELGSYSTPFVNGASSATSLQVSSPTDWTADSIYGEITVNPLDSSAVYKKLIHIEGLGNAFLQTDGSGTGFYLTGVNQVYKSFSITAGTPITIRFFSDINYGTGISCNGGSFTTNSISPTTISITSPIYVGDFVGVDQFPGYYSNFKTYKNRAEAEKVWGAIE